MLGTERYKYWIFAFQKSSNFSMIKEPVLLMHYKNFLAASYKKE